MKKILGTLLLSCLFVCATGYASGTTTLSTGDCVQLKQTTATTLKTKLTSIKSNIDALKTKYSGRWGQFFIKNAVKELRKANKANWNELNALHKELQKTYMANPANLTSTQYVDQTRAVRAKFWNSLGTGKFATGKQDSFQAFSSDYITIFKTNRALRYDIMVLKNQLHAACGDKKMNNESVERIKQIYKKQLDKFEDKKEKRDKQFEKIREQFKKLEEKYKSKQSSVASALRSAFEDLDEDEADREPSE